jgi:TPR repeat protein
MSEADEDAILALFDAASDAWDEGDEAKALALFKQAADQGDLPSMLNIGYFYDEGLGVPIDKGAAMHWYRKAFDLGEASAGHNIAILYREQDDPKSAAEWFAKAVEAGDMDAHVELAKAYLAGDGVEASEAKAREHLELAVAAPFYSEDDEIEDDLDYISEAVHEEAVELLASLKR